jgi:hypothetical protein
VLDPLSSASSARIERVKRSGFSFWVMGHSWLVLVGTKLFRITV